MDEMSQAAPRGASALLAVVLSLVSLQVGGLISSAFAIGSASTSSFGIATDPVSDAVSATAAEFRVDESGAATYSIPLYVAPGTAGVAPKLSLNYSSQGGVGPLGKGWSIGGTSAIARCRATREAGDFIGAATPDGNPLPINFTSSDRYCLDGQRLLASSATCPMAGGASGVAYGTEIDSFQRICAYAGAYGPAFFTVERKDGSISWYGDRDNSASGPNRADGYVETTSPLNPNAAIVWAQTRFQDSLGNYIDYHYLENPAGAGTGEHLLSEVRYTGKTILPGQLTGASAPFATVMFRYLPKPVAAWSKGYASGGVVTQSRQLDAVVSCANIACDMASQLRYMDLNYQTSASGSGVDTLAWLQECRDQSASVCSEPTIFEWSAARYEFATQEKPANLPISGTSYRGHKTADINGDGRQDLVYLREGSSGCSTDFLVTAPATLDASGNATFDTPGGSSICLPARIRDRGEGAYHLIDYNGDGRDDLFVSAVSGQGWRLHPSIGNGFDTSQNLISGIAIPSTEGTKDQVQLADMNGDGLIDIVYPSGGGLKARFMAWSGSSYSWGNERSVLLEEALPAMCSEPGRVCTVSMAGAPTPKTGFTQLADFNGDAASDILIQSVTTSRDDSGRLCEPPPCPSCVPTSIPASFPAEKLRFRYLDMSARSASSTKSGECSPPVSETRLHIAYVKAITPDAVVLGTYAYESPDPNTISLADANADGLTDYFMRYQEGTEWRYRANTGAGLSSTTTALAPSARAAYDRVADVNGDGRADLLQLQDFGAYKAYQARFALPSGGFSGLSSIAGGNTKVCEGNGCAFNTKAPAFGDFDGDGVLDFMSVKVGDNGDMFVSRPASRFTPRDTIVAVTNGLGARTELSYAPLTLGAVYRRASGSRNAWSYGRGSPLIDLLTPLYVVSSASSSSPQPGAPSAMATLHYRYANGRVQAGGRGYLGFEVIDTIDPNQGGGFVATTTTYNQSFPHVGLPRQTVKSLVSTAYSRSTCLTGMVTNACFSTPGQPHPGLGGSWFSNASHFWTAPSLTSQTPLHVATISTDEISRDPYHGIETSRVATSFVYGTHGNVNQTTAHTYTGGLLTATLITDNSYGDDAARWRLGRLTNTTATHRRPGQADVVRKSAFEYAMTGAVTGLLTAEIVEPNGNANQKLRKEYVYDDYGNRTSNETCGAPALACSTTIAFHPVSALQIERYARTAFDAIGRYATTTYEPFWNGTNASEYATQTVVSRNEFGEISRARNIDGVDAIAVVGALGRAYYTWTELQPGAEPGTGAGVESRSTFRWCGGSISCPAGARFRQVTATTGAPAQWSYFDVLGRPILKAVQSYREGVPNADIAATCTGYNAAGKAYRISNPFFLAGADLGSGPHQLETVCQSGDRRWTTTSFDLIGRPTRIDSPQASGNSTVFILYEGLKTTTTNPRSSALATTKRVNGKGELVETTDATGFITAFSYRADGSMLKVSRDAGRGAVDNVFQYDLLGRKIGQDDPDSGTTLFEYNALGELIAQVDSEQNRVESEIDARGRVWRRTARIPDGSVESTATFTFDTAANGLGKPASETISGAYAPWRSVPSMAFNYAKGYGYDVLGRPSTSSTMVDGTTYTTAVAYDGAGRPYRSQDASGEWTKTELSTRGFTRKVCASSASDNVAACSGGVWQEIVAMDAWGNVTEEKRAPGSQLGVTRTYVADTGRIDTICADKAGGGNCELTDERYVWDAAGNLHSRLKDVRYLERFNYDALDRLQTGYVSTNGGPESVSHWAVYDALGNICAKVIDGQGTHMGYDGRAGCGQATGGYGMGTTNPFGPHRVNRIQYGPHDAWLYYDARGNQTFRDSTNNALDRTVRYSADNKPYVVVDGVWGQTNQATRFWYGPDGARYKRENLIDGSFTYYVGSVEVRKQGGSTTYRRDIGGIVLQTIQGAVKTDRYLFHDQLGSLVKTTDANGQTVDTLDYNPNGERRSTADPLQTFEGSPSLTPRGFTGHEHVEGDVIHMNARLYDPVIGRFLQPDPLIQSPDSAQSWNAYTYAFNNPLRYTDPSGMASITFRQVLAVVFAAVYAYFTADLTGSAAVYAAIIGGAITGAIATGTWRGAITGAITGGVTAGVGWAADAYKWGDMARLGAQAVSGGVMESLQGGNFGNGFLAAGLTAAAMPQVGRISSDVGRTAVGAIVGGTISELSGGKFANGAISGSIQAAMAGGQQDGANDGDIIYPAGNNNSMNSHDAIKVPGILAGDRSYYQALADELGIPFFYNESKKFLSDVRESVRQKFSPRTDRLAAKLSGHLSGVNRPIRIIADSQGTIIVRNAAQYFGLPDGSTLELWSPAISYASAQRAASAISGSLIYKQPLWDGANLWAPSANPLRFMSGARDLICVFCVHRANARAFEVSP